MSDCSAPPTAPNNSARNYWLMLLQVTAIACLIFFTNLGTAQLWDRDEPRNAGCAVEMLDRGDWVVPIFNDQLRAQKPVLLYWLMMAAYQVFGVNEFSARFWSALLSVGTVAITFSIGHRLFSPRIAWLSAIILASNIMFAVAARAATPDALLIFLNTLAIAFYVWGTPRQRSPQQSPRLVQSFGRLHWHCLLAMGISMGLATLAKGPIGFLMPMAIMGMHLLISRRDRRSKRYAVLSVINPIHFVKTALAMHPFLLLAIVLLVALPWYYWVGLRTEGDFLSLFFLREHLGRSTTAFENHSGGIWFYPLSILIGFFPWSLFWLPVSIILYRRQTTGTVANDAVVSEAVALMLCWVGVQVGLFSIAQTKLPSYVTPCYPALSILTAVALETWRRKRIEISDTWIKAALVIGVVVGLIMAAIIAAASYHYVAEIFWLPVVGVVVTGGCAAGLWRLTIGDRPATIDSFTVGAICFSWVLFGLGTGSLSLAQNNRLILDRIAKLPPDVAVASYKCLESSWPFYSGRTIYETSKNASAQSLKRDKNWKPKPVTSPESFASQHQRCVFITTDEFSDELLTRLPDSFSALQRADYFLKKKELVLIGNCPNPISDPTQHLPSSPVF